MKTLQLMSILSAVLLSFTAQAAPSIEDHDGSITLSAGESQLVLDKSSGTVTSMVLGGTEFVRKKAGFRPDFWRMMTQEDISNRIPERSAQWKEFKVAGTRTATETDGSVSLYVTYEPACTLGYTLHEDGSLDVSLDFPSSAEPFHEPVILDGPGMMYNPDQTEEEREAELAQFRSWTENIKAAERENWIRKQALIPRIGVRMRLPAKYECAEGGGKLAVANRAGRGFLLIPEDDLQFSTLRMSSYLELHIDARQPDKAEVGAYNLPSEPVSFSFKLMNVKDARR